ncbi:MAG: shikimate dehydrogenase [Desulfobacterales bacterium]|jgi:shikimate dehydrogenase
MKIDQNTGLYGVVGYPLGHSLSPIMHNAAFAAKGLNAVYLAFETQDPAGCVQGIRAMGIKGISVTVPYKSAIISLIDKVDELAKSIGAVNTIVNDNDCLTGYNTDARGALRALEQKIQLSGKTGILVGAGGAAGAIGYALKEKSVELNVANRSPERGKRLARALACPYIALADLAAVKADILIQATSVGMRPQHDDCLVPAHVLKKGMLVMDVIYNPRETRLLKMAKSKGCLTINGLEMFIHQGAQQFSLWTGMDPPLGTMRQAVEQALRQSR